LEAFNGGCVRSDDVFANFIVASPFDAGEDVEQCAGGSVELGPLPAGTEYFWYKRFFIFDTLSMSNTLTVDESGDYIAVSVMWNTRW